MERVLAGWFAEGTSYVANLWSSKSSEAGQGQGDDELKGAASAGAAGAMADGRTRSHASDCLSEVSASSASSRASNASTASRSSVKVQKVMSWMVFGSKRVLYKKQQARAAEAAAAAAARSLEAGTGNHKKTALDILMATTSAAAQAHEVVDPASLRALSVVGRGGYGKVMLMRCSAKGTLVAVKEVAKSNLVDKPGASRSVRPVSTKIEHAEMENLVLHTVGAHPFITSFHGSFQNRDKIFLFLEYCAGGELFQHMQRQGVFSEARTRLYVAEIVSALTYLHGCGIVYRDLKPENILLDETGHIRLTDFGLSIMFNKHGDDNNMRCYSICGTPEYISPEIVLSATTRKNDPTATYGKTVDWWALGVLTYEMLFRVPPFFHRDRKTMLNLILRCDLKFPKSAKVKPVSAEATDFIAGLLKYDEKERLGFGNDGSDKVKAHGFFQGLDFSSLAADPVQPDFVPELKDDADISNFDTNFTKELLRVDPCSACAFNLELTGYKFLHEDFAEAAWFQPAAAAAAAAAAATVAATAAATVAPVPEVPEVAVAVAEVPVAVAEAPAVPAVPPTAVAPAPAGSSPPAAAAASVAADAPAPAGAEAPAEAPAEAEAEAAKPAAKPASSRVGATPTVAVPPPLVAAV